MRTSSIAVLGAGTWGITLGNLLAGKGHRVRLWDASAGYIEVLRKKRENTKGLPGVKIPRTVLITADMAAAVCGAEVILIVSPSHRVREVARQLRTYGTRPACIVIATKGVENKTLQRMSQVVAAELGHSPGAAIVTLSGPSHAEEVSQKIPTAIVAASPNAAAARLVQQLFITPHFRVYTNCDQIGVELGGSLKNVIALAAGICDGLGLGDNTKAALMTRGLAEMTRLGVRLGAQAATFAGLAGMGDLITTCASRHSRNRWVGEELGKGRTLKQILGSMVEVAEGVKTTLSAHQLARKYRVEMPISREVYRVLYQNKSPRRAVADLMGRTAKPE
jgi:glycerol-3-phosphate dehydrogenase (NAD(P)+)